MAKVLVFRDPGDGLWNVCRATFDDLHNEDIALADEFWIAEGVGSWERAMRIANETVAAPSRVPSTSEGES